MVDKPKDHSVQEQPVQRKSLFRSIDEIASQARTDQNSVLKAASDLGLPANDGTSTVSVENAAKIFAHLLPSPDKPRVKIPRKERLSSVGLFQREDTIDADIQAKRWIPLRNPIHKEHEKTQPTRDYSEVGQSKHRVVKAQPAAIPMGALIPPKLFKTRASIPADISGSRVIAATPREREGASNHQKGSLIGLPIPQMDQHGLDELFGLSDDTFYVKLLLDLLQKDLSPHDYGKLFHYLRSAIDFDLQVHPLLLENHAGISPGKLSSPEELRFLRIVCGYKHGLFGYAPSVRLIARNARQRTSNNLPQAIEDVCRLRPMIRGLMTDEAGKRFLAWEVGPEVRRIQIIAFEDLERWIRGLLARRYVRLETELVDVDKPVSQKDWETIHFMASVAENLRESIHYFKPKQNSARNLPKIEGPSPTSKNAHVGTRVTIRDHSKYLIPITIDDKIYFGLEEGFFESTTAATQKHEVREFMRRAPRTPHDAPKTVPVASHTRGGTIFDDARKALPTVTIFRK